MSDQKILIELLPAGNGDSMLLHLGKELWLIDSGYIQQTYRDCLKDKLIAIGKKGGRLSRLE